MGIPTFFRKIINQYPNTHYWNHNENISHLFIDFNCLIYQAYRLLPDKTTTKTIEKELTKEVIKYLEKVCNEIAKPKKLLYLAFDGTVPRAKMMEQRKRRYKGLKVEEFDDYLDKKYGNGKNNINKNITSSIWNPSIHIVPGSRFMNNLSSEIEKAARKGKFITNEIILSDSSVPGEGEHKFISYIRALKKKNVNSDEKICIYGLDADLIVLALTTPWSDKTIILREAQDSPIENEKYGQIGYLYLSPMEYIKAMFETLSVNISKYEFNRLLQDYTFITFLAGNDFIRRILFLKIREKGGGGLDIMLPVYQRLLEKEKKYLIEWKQDSHEPQINYRFFTAFIQEISLREVKTLQDTQRGRNNQLTSEQTRFLEKEKEVDAKTLEMEKFEHSSYFNPMNPEFQKYGHLFKEINYFDPIDQWRHKYYKMFFHFDVDKEPEYLNTICKEYLKSLNFTLIYYLKNIPPDWGYYYPFETAPLAQDLAAYLAVKNTSSLNKNSGNFNKKSTPYLPFQQLMMILPSTKGSDNLPPSYVELMTDINSHLLPYYPIDFRLSAVLGGKFIYSEPILPLISEDKVMKAINKLKLTSEEKKRNSIEIKPKSIRPGEKNNKNKIKPKNKKNNQNKNRNKNQKK